MMSSPKEEVPSTPDCGFAILAPRTHIRLQGKDAKKFLHNLCTNDINRLGEGDGCEAFLCDAKGRILFHVTVLHREDSLWLNSDAGSEEKILSHLDRYLFREDVTITDFSAQFSDLVLIDFSEDAIRQLLGINEAIPALIYQGCSVLSSAGKIWIQWLPIYGNPAIHVSGDKTVIESLTNRLRAAAIKELEPWQLDQRRIEMGWPLPQQDYNDKAIPQELARDDVAISFRKGCYIGQETVARLDALGQLQKKLVGLRFEETNSDTNILTVSEDDKTVITVTSRSDTTKPVPQLGLGMAKRGAFAVGTTVETSSGKAVVIALPMREKESIHRSPKMDS
jgi:folate-binding protein YgfZ